MNSEKLKISILYGVQGSSQVDPQVVREMGNLELIQEAYSPEGFPALNRDGLPDIVLIDLGGLNQIPDWVVPLVSRLPRSEIVVCSQSLDPEFLLRLLALHLQFIPLPMSKENLETAIKRAREKPDYDKSKGTMSRVVALAGSREGVGVTSITTNLAMALAEQTPNKVVLVDLGRPFPAIGQFLNLKETHNINDLVASVDHLDPMFVEKILQPFGTNVSILLGNPDFILDTQPVLTDLAIAKIITTLRGEFEWIVVDLGYWIDSLYRTVIEKSDIVLLLAELSVPDLNNLGRIKKLFFRYGFDFNKVKIVVNRFETKGVLGIKDIENSIMQPVFFQLPSDYASMADAINQGESLATVAPNSKLWRSLKKLAKEIVKQTGMTSLKGKDSRPGLFKRFFSRKG